MRLEYPYLPAGQVMVGWELRQLVRSAEENWLRLHLEHFDWPAFGWYFEYGQLVQDLAQE